MNVETRQDGRRARRQGPRTGRRAVLAALLGVVLLPALTTEAAYQDMTSLLEGGKARERWQAFFVPSPAGAIEKAELSFAAKSARDRLPAGSGLRSGDGALYSLDAPAPFVDTPDEARVSRAGKTGRVLAITPLSPPKAFSAGSILERQSLLRPADLLDGNVRTAFATPTALDAAIEVAMNFHETPEVVAPEPVMVAALDGRTRLPKATGTATTPDIAQTTALGYAPLEAAPTPAGSLFDRVLKPGTDKAFVPPIGRDDHSWAATPLSAEVFSAKEQTCLANGIYFEARGESAEGQAAVAQVILNRVRNPTYPKTICGVVYQNKGWRNRCQFSFACDGIKDRIVNKRAFAQARLVADEVTKGEIWIPQVGSATHYHATYVQPRWASAMEKVDKIGQHIFYRTFGGGWN